MQLAIVPKFETAADVGAEALSRNMAWLKYCPLFSHVPAWRLAVLAAKTTVHRLTLDETLFEHGARAAGLYLVVVGKVALVLPGPGGAEKMLELVEAGGSFGQIALFSDAPFSVSSRAMTECLLLHVPHEAILGQLNIDPLFAQKLLADIATRMHSLVHDIEGYAFRSAAGRLADYLLSLPRAVDTGVVRLPIPKGVLASKLLISRETLSRVLQHWTQMGVIAVSGRSITIRDATRLVDGLDDGARARQHAD